MTLIINILAFVVAISILVAVHEFGHFWVARRLGFKVLRFSIGFGKPIWMRKGRDGVEYAIASLPIGGYVKMLDEREGPVEPQDLPQSFTRRPVWQRVLVLLAGPAMNFIFAIAAYWVLSMAGTTDLRPVVGGVMPDSYAAKAGLRPGDEIVAIDGERTGSRQSVMFELMKRVPDGEQVPLTVRGDEGAGSERQLVLDVNDPVQRHQLTEPGALLVGLGLSYWQPAYPVIVGQIAAGSPAERAGLKTGDRIVSVNGHALRNFDSLIGEVAPRPRQKITLEIERNHAPLTLALETAEGRNPAGQPVGQIGISPGDIVIEASAFQNMEVTQRYGPVAAIGQAGHEVWKMSTFTVRMLWSMVAGKVSVKNVSGPINIAAFAGETSRMGLTYFITFLAVVSISLGILNLMPIPLLDGGQIVYQLAEGLKGSPLSERVQVLGQQVGIAALVLLMGLAFYNDITSRFFK